MDFKLPLVISEGDSELVVEDIVTLEKEFRSIEELGLKLEEAKDILKTLQQRIVEHQTELYNRQHRCCEQCGKRRRSKGRYQIVFRTLFGNVVVQIPRLFQCPCQPRDTKTSSPLGRILSEHTSPELLYMETK